MAIYRFYFGALMALCALMSTPGVYAWNVAPQQNNAQVSGSGISRKGFMAAVGTATLVGGAAANAQEPFKKADYYEPPADSLRDQVILITGGTTGLGLESAKRLAAAGATVVLTSRTSTKGQIAVQDVQAYLTDKKVANPPKIYSITLDLDDLVNVKSFADRFKDTGLDRIDVLMNNAGVMAIPERQLTKDGYERTFQSNHLGHFVLTAQVFPLLSRKGAKVINVSSSAYQMATRASDGKNGLDIDNLNGEAKYGPWTSYGLSKLSNILFTEELQRRAEAAGDTWLTAVTLHPGAVSTDLGRYLVGEEKWNDLKTKGPSGLELVALKAMATFVKSVEDGASTQVLLASEPIDSVSKAAFYTDLKPKKLEAFAQDTEAAKALWAKSEELGGVTFNF